MVIGLRQKNLFLQLPVNQKKDSCELLLLNLLSQKVVLSSAHNLSALSVYLAGLGINSPIQRISYKEHLVSPKLSEIASLVDNIVEQKFAKYGVDKGSPKKFGAQVRAQVQKAVFQERRLLRKEVEELVKQVAKSLRIHEISSRNCIANSLSV